MIIPDVNLLLYAHVQQYREHDVARRWWDDVMNGEESVGLCWAVMLGFVRIATHRRVLERPMQIDEAERYVRGWLAQTAAQIIEPGPRHTDLVFAMLREFGAAAQLTTDAHLAALAVEFRGTIHSADADFGRLAGVPWVNPLT
jgi:hypothetical protein